WSGPMKMADWYSDGQTLEYAAVEAAACPANWYLPARGSNHAQPVPTTIAWQGLTLQTKGWTPVASNDQVFVFYEKAIKSDPDLGPETPLRVEWARGAGRDFQSEIDLYSAVCMNAEVDAQD